MNNPTSNVTFKRAAELRLEDELEQALDKQFGLEGGFSWRGSKLSAPNPDLAIRSLGPITLPLSSRKAESLKKVAAPSGRGDNLVPNARDYWEIDADQIKIRNPVWGSFIANMTKMAWERLGNTPCATPFKCELHKLMLYETGSRSFPYHDSGRNANFIATIIVILPSKHTGGEIHVARGTSRAVYDISKDSEQKTTVLACYADTAREVKPITSGFRLALSYNIYHTEQPSLTDSSAAMRLRQVLTRWSEGAFGSTPKAICYKLEYEYNRSERSKGASGLQGEDASKFLQIQKAVSGLGIALGFGLFKLRIVSDDTQLDEYYESLSYRRRKRIRCYYADENGDDDLYDDDDDDDELAYEDLVVEVERESSVSDLRNLEGISLVSNGTINMLASDQQAVLIPKNAFEEDGPDDDDCFDDDDDYDDYDYFRNSNKIKQNYKRTVLILYLKKNEKAILLNAGGVSYALDQLKKVDPIECTEENRAYAEYLVKSYPHSKTYHFFVMDLSISWGDRLLWQKAADKCGFQTDPTSIEWERVIAAWDKFGFESMRPSFESSLQEIPSLQRKMHFIDLTKARSTEKAKDPIESWCEQQTTRVLSSIPTPRERDGVQTYLSIVRVKGLAFFLNSIIPQLVKFEGTFKFLINFVQTLQSQRKEFEDSPASTKLLQSIFHETLNAALRQWKGTVLDQTPHFYHSYHTSYMKIDDGLKMELVECLASAKEFSLLKEFFDTLIEKDEDIYDKYQDVLIPLVPHLLRIQKKYNISVNSGVYGDFLRWLIETYLRDIMGEEKTFKRHPLVKKAGCSDESCKDCPELDTFMRSAQASRVFRCAEARRKHLEQYVAYYLRDLVSYTMIRTGRPYGLEVTKRKDIAEGHSWEGRLNDAKKFLEGFGGSEILKSIMGGRYAEVAKVLLDEKGDGGKVSALAAAQKPQGKQSKSPPFDKNVGRAGIGAKSGSSFPTKPVAGVKRKSRK